MIRKAAAYSKAADPSSIIRCLARTAALCRVVGCGELHCALSCDVTFSFIGRGACAVFMYVHASIHIMYLTYERGGCISHVRVGGYSNYTHTHTRRRSTGRWCPKRRRAP